MPENKESRLDEELETLGQELGFSVESSSDANRSDDGEALQVICLCHKVDTTLWHLVERHLELLRIPDRTIRWTPFRLRKGQPAYVQRHLLDQLKETHLVVMALSVDLAETVMRYDELCNTLGAVESPLVLPVSLRPVHWTPPFIALDPVPALPVTLWRNQDAARATVAKYVSEVLSGVKAFLESEGDDGSGGELAQR